MSTLTITIIVVFVLGYALIATESLTKINKAAIALLMFVCCWTLYVLDPAPFVQLMHPDFKSVGEEVTQFVNDVITHHLGDTATTLFFLMGAMTIVEIVDQNGGFNWVKEVMKTKSKRGLMWRIAFMTFILSAILDNLTTSIVMIMILRKLIRDHNDRMVYASLIIIAANSGGAFSPIGDVTTIMLWNAGMITAAGVISEIFIPSAGVYGNSGFDSPIYVEGDIAGALTHTRLPMTRRNLITSSVSQSSLSVWADSVLCQSSNQSPTLPPFIGILLVLGVLWTVTELFYRHLHRKKRW